jgi:subfamily B ATP-binding cassette protein MsbA
MNSIKKKLSLENLFTDFRFFHSFLGTRIFFSLILSFTVGLMDGLGLAMFIPLLQIVGGGGEITTDQNSFGNLDYLINGLNSFGISLTITSVLGLILFFFSLKGIFKFLETYYGVILMTTFVKKLRIQAVNSISNINYKYFIQVDSGKVQNTLSGEIERVQWAYRNYMAAAQAFMTILVYVSLAFLANPQFAFFVVIGGGISNLFYVRLYKKTKETSRKITSDGHVFHGLMMQEVNNFKYLRATGQVLKYAEKLNKTIIDLAKSNRKIGFFNSILAATKEPISILVVVLIMFIQVQYFSKELSPIILSLLFFYRSLNLIIVFQNYWNTFLNVSGSLENYQSFLADMNANSKEYNKGIDVKRIDDIVLSGVNFSFNDKLFLKKLTLTIPKNKTIALVGPSGSGKTTLTNIITGLLPIDSGELKVNGTYIQQINLQRYQSRIGYITQDPVIFNDTFFNNVTFWDEKSSHNIQKFKNVIRQASLTEFFEKLEGDENTILGNAGVLISGGQKQRIAIARELYKDIDLLILDEATSALDSGTEKEIQEYFDGLKGKFTLIVIAHRLSTIKNADIIYLLKDGNLEDYGDFESLAEKSNEFKEMVRLQNVDY